MADIFTRIDLSQHCVGTSSRVSGAIFTRYAEGTPTTTTDPETANLDMVSVHNTATAASVNIQFRWRVKTTQASCFMIADNRSGYSWNSSQTDFTSFGNNSSTQTTYGETVFIRFMGSTGGNETTDFVPMVFPQTVTENRMRVALVNNVQTENIDYDWQIQAVGGTTGFILQGDERATGTGAAWVTNGTGGFIFQIDNDDITEFMANLPQVYTTPV